MNQLPINRVAFAVAAKIRRMVGIRKAISPAEAKAIVRHEVEPCGLWREPVRVTRFGAVYVVTLYCDLQDGESSIDVDAYTGAILPPPKLPPRYKGLKKS